MLSVILLVSALGATVDVVEIDGLKSSPPADWKEARPSNTMQLKVFNLPKAEGDKEDTVVTIFFFGQGSGGGLEQNLERWKKQIEPAPGKKVEDVVKIDKFDVGKVKTTYFDATGTYLFRPMPVNPDNIVRKENFRLINVFFASPNGPYFIRLVGPEKSVAAQEKGFKEWVKNFK